MNYHIYTLCAVILTAVCATLTGGSDRPADQSSRTENGIEEIPLAVRIFFRPLPAKMPGSENDTPEIISLGKKLYFEKGISLNKSQACNDCHRLDGNQAGVDYLPTSKGAKGTFGTRNAPTVLNAGFQRAQFWDGRAADLIEQAKGPLLNPIEMAMRTKEDVVNHLKSNQAYVEAFKRAYPEQAEPVIFDNVACAIAAFERTLITPARFDRYLRGEPNALTAAEKHGLHRFMDTGCVECHSSTPIGGRLLQKLGRHYSYKNQSDMGRYDMTKKEDDKFVFKVGMLRNVTRTPPYFHDGQVATVHEAIWLMGRLQLDTNLSPGEIDEIVSFLHTLEAENPIDQTDFPAL